MEIYKLKDEVPGGRRKRGARGGIDGEVDGEVDGGGSAGAGLIITDLRQGVKNPNRVNVFVDGKFSFSLDVAQVVDLKLKIGRVLIEEELAECKKASEFGKAYQRALEWVLVRPRSVRELKDYLWRKLHKVPSGTASLRPVFTGEARLRSRQQPPRDPSGTLSEFSQEIVQRLVHKGYVDDRKFAEYYVENRFVKKGVSQKRLRIELMKKGVDKEIIEEVLDGRNDEAEIDKIIAKKWGKYDEDKLINYLCRQGFSYQLAQSRVRDCGKD